MLKRLGLVNSNLTTLSKIRAISRKLKKRFSKPILLSVESERTFASLPSRGENTSLEEVLNSRCTSDFDGIQRVAHWGMFDIAHKMLDADMQRILELSRIPRYTTLDLGILRDGNTLVFTAEPKTSGIEHHWLMVESGMHQQAVMLTCAALGAGCLIMGLGINGMVDSGHELALVRMQIGPMNPSYDGSYWTSLAPGREQAWQSGNLPTPLRTGHVPFLSAMSRCRFQNASFKQMPVSAFGQILWAARGRTPHYYNSAPWGLTIPTWSGNQDLSRLFVINNGYLYSYKNWYKKKPTHSLFPVVGLEGRCLKWLELNFPKWNSFLVLSAKDDHANKYWEIGYQLLNIMLQADVLGIGYKVVMLDESQREFILDSLAIPNAAVLVAVQTEGALPLGR